MGTAAAWLLSRARYTITGKRCEIKKDDRVRLTRLHASKYGLSVRRHTGRWERTSFAGSMEDMVETIQTLMQRLVAS